MTVTTQLVRDVRTADSQLPPDLPLLTASDRIAHELHQPPAVIAQILLGQYTQERAA